MMMMKKKKKLLARLNRNHNKRPGDSRHLKKNILRCVESHPADVSVAAHPVLYHKSSTKRCDWSPLPVASHFLLLFSSCYFFSPKIRSLLTR